MWPCCTNHTIVTPYNPCSSSNPCPQNYSSNCVIIDGSLSCLTGGTGITLTNALSQICATLQANQIVTVTIPISSAQILNSFTTPITLLPAPGGGYQWNVISVQGYYTYSTAVYNFGGHICGITQGDISYLIDGGAEDIYNILTTSTDTGQFKVRLGEAPNGTLSISFYNQPVKFYTQTANPTTGAGTLLLTITAIKTA